MRAAGCYQVDKVLYSGQRYQHAAKFVTDTKNISTKIPLVAVDDILAKASDETEIVCIELVEGATPLPLFVHPDRALYIFGPEDGTISQQVVDAAHHVVYVPTVGCMNLAATANVVLYDRLAKQGNIVPDDELIKRSRDTNNKVKIK